MKWNILEDEIVCKFYFKHLSDFRHHIDELNEELVANGFNKRSYSSLVLKLCNFQYLNIGKGMKNASLQSVKVFNKLKLSLI